MTASTPASLMDRIGRFVSGEVSAFEPLAPKTSVRVGGAAELFVRPRSREGIVPLLRFLAEESIDLTVLGGGANTLVGDGGVPGVTLKLPADLVPEEVQPCEEGGRVTLGAGVAIARLVHHMKRQGWVGAEALAGIPGSLGGAVSMNAGTKGGECMASVEALELATQEGLGWVPRSELAYGYRHTQLPAFAVVTRIRFLLRHGDAQASAKTMEDDLAYRRHTQPLSQPNFGSVFQNPPGNHAGRLIESVALKGHTLGGAQISPRHANWIVNLGGATARDVTSLMKLMQDRVRDATGVELNPEVKRVGVFT